jgi:hypothetical protein
MALTASKIAAWLVAFVDLGLAKAMEMVENQS